MRSCFHSSLAAAVVLLASALPASAQLWVNYTNTSTNWSTPSNWFPAVVPVSGAGTALTFSSVPFTLPPTTPTFQTSGNYGSVNDNATTFVLNRIVLDGYGAPDAATSGIAISSSNAAGGLSFQGPNPTILQNGSGSVNFADGAATND